MRNMGSSKWFHFFFFGGGGCEEDVAVWTNPSIPWKAYKLLAELGDAAAFCESPAEENYVMDTPAFRATVAWSYAPRMQCGM